MCGAVCRRLVSHPPHQILATPLRTGLPGLRKRDTRFEADMVWPISTLLMADVVFCVADMVVADVVCGRHRRFPSKTLGTQLQADDYTEGGRRFVIVFNPVVGSLVFKSPANHGSCHLSMIVQSLQILRCRSAVDLRIGNLSIQCWHRYCIGPLSIHFRYADIMTDNGLTGITGYTENYRCQHLIEYSGRLMALH